MNEGNGISGTSLQQLLGQLMLGAGGAGAIGAHMGSLGTTAMSDGGHVAQGNTGDESNVQGGNAMLSNDEV